MSKASSLTLKSSSLPHLSLHDWNIVYNIPCSWALFQSLVGQIIFIVLNCQIKK